MYQECPPLSLYQVFARHSLEQKPKLRFCIVYSNITLQRWNGLLVKIYVVLTVLWMVLPLIQISIHVVIQSFIPPSPPYTLSCLVKLYMFNMFIQQINIHCSFIVSMIYIFISNVDDVLFVNMETLLSHVQPPINCLDDFTEIRLHQSFPVIQIPSPFTL